jgi:chaperonin GroES
MAVATKKKSTKKAKSKAKLQPLGDRIVVERDQVEEMTAGGLVLPGGAAEKPARGTVISVGEGRLLADGSRGALQLKPGDRVIFSSYAPNEIKLGDDEMLLMREEDVLAIIE